MDKNNKKGTGSLVGGIHDPRLTAFVRSYWDLANAEFAELEMPKPTDPRLGGSIWIYLGQGLVKDSRLKGVRMAHKTDAGKLPDRVDIWIHHWGNRVVEVEKSTASIRPPEVKVVRADGSLAFSTSVPRIEMTKPFAPQEAAVREALASAVRLQRWWNANLPEIVKLAENLPGK